MLLFGGGYFLYATVDGWQWQAIDHVLSTTDVTAQMQLKCLLLWFAEWWLLVVAWIDND